MKKNQLSIACLTLLFGVSLTGCGGGGEEDNATKPKAPISPTNVTLGAQSVTTSEGDAGDRKTVTVSLRLSKAHSETLKFNYTMNEENEFATGRYEKADGSTEISAGTRDKQLEFIIFGNNRHEQDGRVSVNFSLVGTPSNVNLTQDKATIIINDDDPVPVVTLDVQNVDVREGVGTVDIKASLDRPTYQLVTARLAFDGLASINDYSVDSEEIVFEPDSMNSTTSINIFADDIIEGSETIDVSFLSAANASTGDNSSMRIIIQGDLKLTDTGVRSYYNNGNFNSSTPDAEHPQQDADFGLDTNANYNTSNGLRGLSYNKIDGAGNSLPANETGHECVYDAHTGLTWEIKGDYFYHEFGQEDDAIEIEYTNNHYNNSNGTYMWYQNNNTLNGGSKGGVNSKELKSPILASQQCMFPHRENPLHINTVTQKGCTADQYEELINKKASCGFLDWRLPSISELQTLVIYENALRGYDENYFPDSNAAGASHTNEDFVYLSSTPSVDNEASVWCLDASERRIKLCNKTDYHHVRLVRGQKF